MASPSLGESVSTRTQADSLPGFKNITIPNVKKLQQISHLRYWQNVIMVALDCRGLGPLISKALARPTPDHSRYEDWNKWSILVGKWLVKNLDDQFAVPLKAIHPDLAFADETYTAITTMDFSNGEDQMSKELMKLWTMRRSQYSTIGSYVDAWREQVVTCFKLNLGLSWYAATKLMLMELKDEIPVLCNFINYQIRDHSESPGVMDINQFNAITNGILESVYRGSWRDRPRVE
ncbi:Amino acid/polyamine transporter I [Penicillium paradoxum]|uniref:Amino acid/polyamine transporter I n=1 Tax=Penicillium paradoxum TaxID=176176 RepID=UPI0025470470|nr:Amino acid/polyamine transporter I [Penicillium paradoxum]KAJ5780801.1 Amino acid/polyamine transporter I [Penicillium paradoxum]